MNNKHRRYFRYLAVLSFPFLLSCFTSCKKDSGLGSNVLPSSDILGAYIVDTSTVVTSIKLKDSLLTTSTALYQLGSYNDPVFGMTKASIYTQVVLPGNAATFSFSAGYKLDSVVLAIPFNKSGLPFYGALTPQTFVVDTIAPGGDLKTGKAYYSDTTVSCGTKHVGMATFAPNPYDSVHIEYDTALGMTSFTPQLRIQLDSNFGKYLMNAGSSYTNTSFLTVLRGFKISVSNSLQLPGQGGIMSLDPNGAGLIFYYRINGVRQAPQLFQMGNACAYFLHFDHDYSTTPFYVKGKDSVLAPYTTYIQAMAGVKTQISFPFLSNWKNLGPVIVNRAEVEIPVNVSATGTDVPPAEAYLVRDSAGHAFTLPDENLGINFYGGIYDAANRRYVFNITRYMQSVLDGKTVDRGLYLIAGASAITANGAVLYGGAKNTGLPRIRLKMYYTPLKH